MVMITFIQPDGVEKTLDVEVGTTLMTAAVDNAVDGIQGDCGGACSCATCHCYIDDGYKDKIPAAEDVELSMIDFAIDPQPNSRLGCQVQVTEALEGMVVKLPESQY